MCQWQGKFSSTGKGYRHGRSQLVGSVDPYEQIVQLRIPLLCCHWLKYPLKVTQPQITSTGTFPHWNAVDINNIATSGICTLPCISFAHMSTQIMPLSIVIIHIPYGFFPTELHSRDRLPLQILHRTSEESTRSDSYCINNEGSNRFSSPSVISLPL